jgi:hypothetical protein
VEIKAEGMPICRGSLGISDGCYAIKIHDWLRRSKNRQLHELVTASRGAEGTGSRSGGDLVPA